MASTPKPPTVEELREAMKANRLEGWSATKKAAEAEHATLKAATPAGEKVTEGPIAAWMATAEYKALRDARQDANGGERRVRRINSGPKATYTRNGKPLSASHDSLSYMAYSCTRKILSEDSERMGVKEFKELLAKSGIGDPEHSTWEITLSNGVRVGALMPDDQAEAKNAAVKAEKAPTTKTATPKNDATAKAGEDPHFKPVPKPSPRKSTPRKATASTKKAASAA